VWALVDEPDPRTFGAALLWAANRQARRVEVIVDTAASPVLPGLLAWRAGLFAAAPTVWALTGRRLEPATPTPPPPHEPPEPAAWDAAAPLAALGAELVAEHGQVLAEVLGLEIARLERAGSGWRVVVGVGAHDRLAQAELRPDEDPLEAAQRAVQVVRRWRRAGVARHPANTLARERWLRAVLVGHPALVDAERLAPAPPALTRSSLLDPSPAPALGRTPEGRAVVVVASAGIDPDLVPSAAHARAVLDADAELVVALPAADDHPLTRRLAAGLARPARVVAIPAGWEEMARR
jgi:hypothetical protein